MYQLLIDLLLVLFFSCPAFLPLLAPGYPQGADAVMAPWLSLLIESSLNFGELFPRWSPDQFLRYGFPLFNFYGTLSYYPIALMHMTLGLDLVVGTKLVMAASVVVLGIGTFLLSREIFKHQVVALLASVLTVYSPSTMINLYVGSGLPGMLGSALLPFVLLAFIRLTASPTPFACGLAAVSISATVLTHNTTGVIAAGVALALIVWRYLQKRSSISLALGCLALLLGIGVASFFWLPAMAEINYTHTEGLYSGHGDFRYHLMDPIGEVDENRLARIGHFPGEYRQTKWGLFDLHLAYPYGPLPFKPGLLQGLLLAVCLVGFLSRRLQGKLAGFLMVVVLTTLFLHTTWSYPLWENIPILPLFQFPYRFAPLFSLALAITSSGAIFLLFRRWWRIAMLVVGLAAILTTSWMVPSQLGAFAEGLPATLEGLFQYELRERNRIGTALQGQYIPRWVDWDNESMSQGDIIPRYDQAFPRMQWVGEAAYIPSGSKAWIVAARRGQGWMEAVVEAGEVTRLTFHTLYFPGWTVYIDGQRGQVEASPWQEFEEGRKAALGVCQVDVPEGRHMVRLVFEDTPVRLMAKVISALGILGVGSLFVVAYWRRGEGFRSGRQLVLLLLIWVLVAGVSYAAYRWLVSSRAASVEWVDNRVVRDFVKGAEERSLELDAPLGAKVDDYVHPRVFTIGGERRSVVYMHPPSSARTKVWLPERARLEFAVGVDPAVWDKSGDGVEFEVLVGEGGAIRKVYSRYIDPKGNPDDRRWIDETIDLDGYAHREVEVVLRTQPGATGEFDWAGWAEPRITIP